MKKHAHLLLLLCFYSCLIFLVLKIGRGSLSFVDAHVYLRAFSDYAAGLNPYRATSSLNFVYPPIFLSVGSWLIRMFSLPVVKTLYIVAHVIAAMAVPWILYRHYIRDSKYSVEAFYLLYMLAPGLSFLLSLDTGNIAIIAYALMLSAGAIGLRTNKWLLFYCVVFLCAGIKITYLPLLLIPLLCSATSQVLPALACAGLAGIGLKMQGWFHPALLNDFRLALRYQTLKLGDVGTGVFGIVFHAFARVHVRGIVIPALIYAACALICVGAATLIRLRSGNRPVAAWAAMVLCVSIVAVPRIEYYDLCYACPIVLFLVAEKLRLRTFLLLYLVVALPALYFRFRLTFTAFDGGYQSLAALLLLIWLLGRLYFDRQIEGRSAAFRLHQQDLA